jgi:hypothetical protein
VAHTVAETLNGKTQPVEPPKKRRQPRPRPEPLEDEDRELEPAAEADSPEQAEISQLCRDIDTPFFDYLRMWPDSLWRNRLMVYLNRTAPIIDRDRTGNYHYVEKFVKPFTQDNVKKTK